MREDLLIEMKETVRVGQALGLALKLKEGDRICLLTRESLGGYESSFMAYDGLITHSDGIENFKHIMRPKKNLSNQDLAFKFAEYLMSNEDNFFEVEGKITTGKGTNELLYSPKPHISDGLISSQNIDLIVPSQTYDNVMNKIKTKEINPMEYFQRNKFQHGF